MNVSFVEEELGDDLRKIILKGTLDAPGTMSIEDDFQRTLARQPGQVILDLTEVDFMSSYGLRMLLKGAKFLANAGGGLHLAGANPNVMGVIKLADYDSMFPVYESVEEAILFLTG